MSKRKRPSSLTVRRYVGREVIRRAVADYMQSEGCGCCGDYLEHKMHTATLGTLLRVPPYKDGSGHDFRKFRTPRSKP